MDRFPRDPTTSTEPTSTGPITVSCGDCTMQHTSHCDGCIVTFICNREPDDAVVIDADEARAVRLLVDAGLVPGLRLVPRTG